MKTLVLEDLGGEPCRRDELLPGLKRSLSIAALSLQNERHFGMEAWSFGARDPQLEMRSAYIARMDSFSGAMKALPRFGHNTSEYGESVLFLRNSENPSYRFRRSPWTCNVCVVSVAGTTTLPRTRSPHDGLNIARGLPIEPSLVILHAPSGQYRLCWMMIDYFRDLVAVDLNVFSELFSPWRGMYSISCFQGINTDLPRLLSGEFDGLSFRSPMVSTDLHTLRWYSGESVVRELSTFANK